VTGKGFNESESEILEGPESESEILGRSESDLLPPTPQPSCKLCYGEPYRHDRNRNGGGVLAFLKSGYMALVGMIWKAPM